MDISIVITDNLFFIFSKTKLKCKIPFKDILAITKSTISTKSGELVVHIRTDQDRRIKTDFRDEIIEILKQSYKAQTKQSLPLYGVKFKKLNEFSSTKKDMKKGIKRIPLELARLRDDEQSAGSTG
jgi:mevalonate kinase